VLQRGRHDLSHAGGVLVDQADDGTAQGRLATLARKLVRLFGPADDRANGCLPSKVLAHAERRINQAALVVPQVKYQAFQSLATQPAKNAREFATRVAIEIPYANVSNLPSRVEPVLPVVPGVAAQAEDGFLLRGPSMQHIEFEDPRNTPA